MSEDMKDKNVHGEEHVHDEHCNHDHDHEHEHGVTVMMENEAGTSEEYPVVDEFEYNDSVYVLVENPDGTVTPLRSVGEEGDLEFLTEDEFNEVAAAYNEFMDEFGDEDDDEDEDEDDDDLDADFHDDDNVHENGEFEQEYDEMDEAEDEDK